MKIELQKNSDGELYIEFPSELMDKLEWKLGDDIDVGEIKGHFSLNNRSKLFRDADEARKKAISIDME
jgi:hypothetical protein